MSVGYTTKNDPSICLPSIIKTMNNLIDWLNERLNKNNVWKDWKYYITYRQMEQLRVELILGFELAFGNYLTGVNKFKNREMSMKVKESINTSI